MRSPRKPLWPETKPAPPARPSGESEFDADEFEIPDDIGFEEAAPPLIAELPAGGLTQKPKRKKPSPQAVSKPPGRRKIAFAIIAGVVVALGAAGVWFTWKPADWSAPTHVTVGETKFLVELKKPWYAPGTKKNRKGFYVVYSYKNLGPRRQSFWLGGGSEDPEMRTVVKAYKQMAAATEIEEKIEIRTDNGHIYSGFDAGPPIYMMLNKTNAPMREVGGWIPKAVEDPDGVGESALFFDIPKDETPTELVTHGPANLNRKLPPGEYPFRRETKAFGWLPVTEDVVPGLAEG